MSDAADNLKTYQQRIMRDKGICGGEAVFKGTRVTLRTVLVSLADGDSADEILKDFPSLKPEDIQAAIAFAAAGSKTYFKKENADEWVGCLVVATERKIRVLRPKREQNS